MADPIFQAGPITGIGAPQAPKPAAPRTPGSGRAFDDVLAKKLQGADQLRFSGHAPERLVRRNIKDDEATLSRLHGGVVRAAAKGSRESLVLLDDTAFVVSVRNRTVVTAVDKEHMHDQVFTNIDSAVIA